MEKRVNLYVWVYTHPTLRWHNNVTIRFKYNCVRIVNPTFDF